MRKNAPADVIRGAIDHEALVDRDTFDAVQQMLFQNRKNKTPKRGAGYLLTALMRCGHCGKNMIESRRPDGPGRTLPRYLCGGYNIYGRSFCNRNGIDEAPLFECLTRKLRDSLLNPETLERIREDCWKVAREGHGSDPGEVGRLEKHLAELEKQATAAARKYLLMEDERLSDDCKRALDGISAERVRVERDLAAARIRAQETPDVDAVVNRAVEVMQRFEKAIADGDPMERRVVLRGIIDHVDLFFEHRPGKLRTVSTFVRGVLYVKAGIGLLHTRSILRGVC